MQLLCPKGGQNKPIKLESSQNDNGVFEDIDNVMIEYCKFLWKWRWTSFIF